jgi:hypothetical protein
MGSCIGLSELFVDEDEPFPGYAARHRSGELVVDHGLDAAMYPAWTLVADLDGGSTSFAVEPDSEGAGVLYFVKLSRT